MYKILNKKAITTNIFYWGHNIHFYWPADKRIPGSLLISGNKN